MPAARAGPIRNIPDMWAPRNQPARASPIRASSPMNTADREMKRSGIAKLTAVVHASRKPSRPQAGISA